MQPRSPAQTFALALGALLVGAGILGFFYNGTFTGNESVHDDVLGIFSVNGWHNTLHVAAGVVCLSAASSWEGARTWMYALGGFFTAIALWGFILGAGHSILSIVPVNTADNLLHLLLGAGGILAAVATPATPAPTTIPAAE